MTFAGRIYGDGFMSFHGSSTKQGRKYTTCLPSILIPRPSCLSLLVSNRVPFGATYADCSCPLSLGCCCWRSEPSCFLPLLEAFFLIFAVGSIEESLRALGNWIELGNSEREN